MKPLLYLHARVTPLAIVLARVCYQALARWLAPVLLHKMPGPQGQKVTLILLWLLGLVCQAIMLWLLAQLVDLAIGLFELWAIMAGRFVEMDS